MSDHEFAMQIAEESPAIFFIAMASVDQSRPFPEEYIEEALEILRDVLSKDIAPELRETSEQVMAFIEAQKGGVSEC